MTTQLGGKFSGNDDTDHQLEQSVEDLAEPVLMTGTFQVA